MIVIISVVLFFFKKSLVLYLVYYTYTKNDNDSELIWHGNGFLALKTFKNIFLNDNGNVFFFFHLKKETFLR